MHAGGSAEMVDMLIRAEADVNEQFKQPTFSLMGVVFMIARGKYLYQSSQSQLMQIAHHSLRATPLMFAILAGQYEGAATLLVHGAKVHLKNYRQKTALDLAREVSAPEFVLLGESLHYFHLPFVFKRVIDDMLKNGCWEAHLGAPSGDPVAAYALGHSVGSWNLVGWTVHIFGSKRWINHDLYQSEDFFAPTELQLSSWQKQVVISVQGWERSKVRSGL